MAKYLMIGAWACLVSVVSMVLALTQLTPEASSRTDAPAVSLDYVKTPVITVPVLRQGKIDGYVIAQLVYVVDRSSMGSSEVPVDALITDELYRAMLANPQLDISKNGTIDTAAFTKGLTSKLNARLASSSVQEILVEQFNYLSKAEIREHKTKRQTTASKAATKDGGEHGAASSGEVTPDASAALSGHETIVKSHDESSASSH